MNELILDGSLIATAFAFLFFFVFLRFLCYFLFLKKVGNSSPINPNLTTKKKSAEAEFNNNFHSSSFISAPD